MENDPHFPSVPNFRRILGTRLYRSSTLDNATQEDVERLKALGIKTILDLRSQTSWEETIQQVAPERLIDSYYTPHVVTASGRAGVCVKPAKNGAPITSETVEPCGVHYYTNIVDTEFGIGVAREAPWYRQLQLIGYGIAYYTVGSRTITRRIPEWCLHKENEPMILTQYKGMIKYCGKKFATALRVLLDETKLPAVVICAQGKDRTGVLSAFIQDICGEDTEVLVDEYAKTQAALPELAADMKRMSGDVGLDETFATADPETMEKLITYIQDQHTSIPKYLESIGFTSDEQKKLRANVVADQRQECNGVLPEHNA